MRSAGYVYDEAGNLKCDAAHQCASGGATSVASNLTINRAYYDYDAENRLVRAGSGGRGYADGGTSYTYDGEGRRVRKATTGGEVTVFVYDAAGRAVAEYSNQVQSNGTSYLTQDHQERRSDGSRENLLYIYIPIHVLVWMHRHAQHSNSAGSSTSRRQRWGSSKNTSRCLRCPIR